MPRFVNVANSKEKKISIKFNLNLKGLFMSKLYLIPF